MGIGFSFTAKLQDKQSFFFTLDAAAEKFGYDIWRDEGAARARLCRLGVIFFRFEDDPAGKGAVLSGECQSNLAGAGFHAAAIDFVDALAEEAGFLVSMEDGTAYYETRDFDAMRRDHFYPWLSSVADFCREAAFQDEMSGFCLCWPPEQYTPRDIEGTMVTPFGRFGLAEMARRVELEGIDAFARSFFIWNEREKDARCHYNSALSMLWEDCCFMPGDRSEEDRAVNSAILDELEAAAALDPSLPFPKDEYALLCALNGHPPIDLAPLADYRPEYPIGYRRDNVTWKLGNLSLCVPGCFLFEYDEKNGESVWRDGRGRDWHTLRAAAFQVGEEEAAFQADAFQNLFPEEFPIGGGWCRAAWAGITGEGEGLHEKVVAQAVCERQLTLITISYDQPQGREWAFSLLREMRALPDGGEDDSP